MKRRFGIAATIIITYFVTGAFFSVTLPKIYTSLPQWSIELVSTIYEPVFVTLFSSF